MPLQPPSAPYEHIYPVVNLLVERAIEQCEDDAMPITCAKGCSHCCFILVESFIEEAQHIVHWLNEQPKARRQAFLKKIQHNAQRYADFCQAEPSRHAFAGLLNDNDPELDDDLCNDYFYQHREACPFLNTENGACQAYAARPTSCRLHLVSSNPDFCAVDAPDDVDAEVPQRIEEELSNDVAAINDAAARDGRRGHLSTVLMHLIQKQHTDWLTVA